MTDFISLNQLETFLPREVFDENYLKYPIRVMLTTSYSLGGVKNITKVIELTKPNKIL